MSTAEAIDFTDLSLGRIDNRPTVRSHRIVQLHCPRGKVETHYYPVIGGKRAVVFVGGVGERQDSPAANVYPMLCEDMQHRRIAALRIKTRVSSDPSEMLYDLRLGIRFLESEGRSPVALIGFASGAIAAVRAALAEPSVTAVAMLSTIMGTGNEPIEQLRPDCKLLMIHGGRDAYSSVQEAKNLYEKAHDPKELLILPRNTHTLNENSTEVNLRLRDWLLGWTRA
jgi:dienelactone hydrolase